MRRSFDQLAGRALRLLAFAARETLPAALTDYDGSEGHPGSRLLSNPANYPGIESELVFLGVAGLHDPPRPEVRAVTGVLGQGLGWGAAAS
jgi:magnesium-transporting ATPase (P-type)